MNKSRIEWTDYTLNPIKGLCPLDCKDNQGKSYCYARRMYKRFKWNPEIRWDMQPLLDIAAIHNPSRIFIGSTIELFGEWISDAWLNTIFRAIEGYPYHTFIFLTKQPQNLIRWSPFPDNCLIGTTVTDRHSADKAQKYMLNLANKNKTFVSIEPFLDYIPWVLILGYSWVIIGQQTPVSKKTMPKIEWIQEIVEACNKVGVPVFLKDNLKDMLHTPEANMPILWKDYPFKLHQEYPNA